ncbi:Mitogen-activated protein kinase kinase kinase MLK4 [Liparis tanakae]|uniref:Mitogen-activated protein kinase kinase kinase MLK4 n=1 Tax=Liparis tanakae TaxID=230148 RepID=A0A4Z2I870_9TELE|nr:Mitogen-activated protein kinase kinase kinase MLK4 [Liparis tanakae]
MFNAALQDEAAGHSGAGKDEAFSQECPDSSSKPKQLKFPNQVYIDLPLWRDEQQPQSPGGHAGSGDSGVGSGGQGGAPETPEDTATSTSSASTTPQVTPTNSLKRASARRRTDSVLYGCGALLASVALGYDLREALKNSSPGEDGEPPRDEKEKKKKEGLFQRATRFRRSTSPPGGRSRKDEAAAANHAAAATQPVNLISMSAVMERNSAKCVAQTERAASQSRPGKAEPAAANPPAESSGPGPAAAAEDQSNETAADAQTPPPAQSQPAEQNHHSTGTRLRRKKYTSNHISE